MAKKIIPNRYFDELKDLGHTVPRNENTGKVLTFKVGKEYTIFNENRSDRVKAVCSQNSPYALKIIKEKTIQLEEK